MTWTRECPKCGKELIYEMKQHFQVAEKRNSWCYHCAARLRGEQIRKRKPQSRSCPSCGREITYRRSDSLARATKNGSLCKSCAKVKSNPMHEEEYRERAVLARAGYRHSAETKRKLRVTAIERIEKANGQVMPNYNPDACRLIEAYAQEHGYTFQHAENGGEFRIPELGYWVDGYDAAKNVVIEVDEPTHRYKKDKDAQRQREIEQHLGCQFIRIQL